MKRVLVAEDEASIREFVVINLKRNGYDVVEASDGAQAIEKYKACNGDIDVAILDIMMPYVDGLEVCKQLRAMNANLGIIMLTAKTQEMDKVSGLLIGADDYVTKPFDPDELMARVKTILKRYSINSSNVVKIGDVIFDGDKYEVRYQDQIIHLPLKQFELAFELAKNPNQIFTREQLIEKIWGMDYDGFDRTVDVHIKRIRENLGHLPGFKVVTVRGLGYKIEVE